MLTVFYRTGCPYCRRAEEILASLLKKHPEYREIQIRRVEENEEPELAARYDYWYVPSFFCGDKKLYEANSADFSGNIEEILNRVLASSLPVLVKK